VIDRYPAGHPQAGQPTGVLREGPALKCVLALVKNTDEEIRQWITMGEWGGWLLGCLLSLISC
jgi:hypothetical protein